jgi:hypothetical protein
MVEDNLNDDEKIIIEHIKNLLEKDDILVLSNEEIRVVKNMISVYQSFIAFGKIGTLAKNLLVGFASCVGAYYALQTWGVGILKGLLGI